MKKIKITRTMSNALIIGETEEIEGGIKITKPFSVIPMQEGIRLMPLDIELIGVQMQEIVLTNDKIMYVNEASEVMTKEYEKLLNPPKEDEAESKAE